MNYKVTLMDKSELTITESEFANLKDKEGLVFIPSLGEAINTKSILRISPIRGTGFLSLPEPKSDPKRVVEELDKMRKVLREKYKFKV